LPLDFTTMRGVILAYSDSKELPMEEQQQRKTEGTDALSVSIKGGKGHKDTMVDLLVSKYKTKNPIIAGRAKLAGTPIVLGARHISGQYLAIDALTLAAIVNPIFTETYTTKKGKVTVKKLLGDENGSLIFGKHRLGTVVVTTEQALYVKATDSFPFKKNGLNEFVVKMKKV